MSIFDFIKSPKSQSSASEVVSESSEISPDAGVNEHEKVYWTEDMADILEVWGEGNTWHELLYLFGPLSGKVLDIACGTGKNMSDLAVFKALEVHGCDISHLLIARAVEKGLSAERLTVCNATEMPFTDGEFDYCYSIGSLEHFRDGDEVCMIRESARISRVAAFHMIPLSRSGKDEGWIEPFQGYYNNSREWWQSRFETEFRKVVVLPSLWNDAGSIGHWFLCFK